MNECNFQERHIVGFQKIIFWNELMIMLSGNVGFKVYTGKWQIIIKFIDVSDNWNTTASIFIMKVINVQ